MKLHYKSLPARIFIIAFALLFVSIAFQNCGDIAMDRQLPAEVVFASTAEFKATACPRSQALPSESTKFIFVMDMSVSNIGDWKADEFTYGTYYKFQPEKGTDPTGARFDAVKSFIETCGSASGNQFAIIAFANTAGRIVTEGGIKKLKCDGKFTSPSTAIADLNFLKQTQIAEIPMYTPYITKYLDDKFVNGILGSTNYEQALGCVEDMVVHDLQDPITSKVAENYQIFYVSDGRPRDKTGTFCEDKTKYPTLAARELCYADGIQRHVELTMQAALGNNKKMKMHAIYYSNPLYEDAYVADVKKYMGTISRLGDTGDPILMGSFFEAMDDGENPLCTLLGVTSAIEYKPDLIRLINLSATRVDGELMPDSDMDGIIDAEEILQGSNPTNSRSLHSKILDGVCKRLGGKAACTAYMQGKTCNSLALSMGVSQCDLVALQIDKLYAHPDMGIDSDKDGMPDLAEVLKGTDPGLADMHMDVDGDLIPNAREILEGRDPFRNDADLIPEKLMKAKVQYKGIAGGLCEYGAWELQVETMPGAETVTYAPTTPTDRWAAHVDNENVFLVYYRSDPRNSAEQGIEFYKKTFTARYKKLEGASAYQISISEPEILPADFEKAGEVQP